MEDFILGGSNQQRTRPRFLPNQPRGLTGATRQAILSAALLAACFCFGGSPLQAQGRLTLTPNYVNFGTVAVNATGSVAITAKNTGNATLTFSGQRLSAAPQFSVSGFPLSATLAAGKSATFTVKFAPTTSGAKSGTLTFTSNAANSSVVIWLNGSGAESTISATPASAAFASVAVGVTNTQTIRLENSGTSDDTISAVAASGAPFSVSGISLPLSLGAGMATTFNVAFAPKAAGAVTGSVKIEGNFPAITVAATGTGASGTRVISASATTEAFGNVSVGSAATADLSLTDTGNSSVTISGVSYTGGGVSGSGGASVTLNPEQSTTLTVKFAPTKAGSVTGSVVVTSNATDSPFTIAVSGSGVAAATHSVSLHWAASASSGVAGYDVYRSTVSGGPYSKLASESATVLDYTDSDVQPAATYYYVVTSVDSNGAESAYSSQVSAAIP